MGSTAGDQTDKAKWQGTDVWNGKTDDDLRDYLKKGDICGVQGGEIFIKMVSVDEVPEELEQAYLLAQKTLDSGKKAKNEWNDAIGAIDEKFEAAQDSNNPYNALVGRPLEFLIKFPLYAVA